MTCRHLLLETDIARIYSVIRRDYCARSQSYQYSNILFSRLKYCCIDLNSTTETAAHCSYTLTIHVRVTILIVLLQWASCAIARLKFMGGLGAVLIKNKVTWFIFCPHGIQVCNECFIAMPIIASIVPSCYDHALPWQLCTFNVTLELWSVLDGLHVSSSICDWEHPISVPVSSVLTFLLVSLEVNSPEGLLATTSAMTLSSSLVWLLLCRMVILQKTIPPEEWVISNWAVANNVISSTTRKSAVEVVKFLSFNN